MRPVVRRAVRTMLVVASLVLFALPLARAQEPAGGCIERLNAMVPAGIASPVGTAVNPGASLPVITVHGWRGDSSSLGYVRDTIVELGIDAVPIAFDYSHHHPGDAFAVNQHWVTHRDIGPRLREWIMCLSDVSLDNGGPGRVAIVAHSMGGLAAREAIGADPSVGDRVVLVGTLGTPYQGSAFGGVLFDGQDQGIAADIASLFAGDDPAKQALGIGSAGLAALPPFPTNVAVWAGAGDILVERQVVIDLGSTSYGDGVVMPASATNDAQLVNGLGGAEIDVCSYLIPALNLTQGGRVLPCTHSPPPLASVSITSNVNLVNPLLGQLAAASIRPARGSDDPPLPPPDPGSPSDPADLSVMVVMDVSNSMNDTDRNGVVKIDGAKNAVAEFVANGDVRTMGLRSYPGPGSRCGPGRIEVPLGSTADPAHFLGRVSALVADGDTPTAEALRAAASDIPVTAAQKVIVLVSDGESNCGESACPAAAALIEAGFDVDAIHAVGFETSAEGDAELQCISDAGNGRFVRAEDSAELAEELVNLTAPELAIEIEAPTAIDPTNPADPSVVEVTTTVRNTGAGQPALDVIVELAFDTETPPIVFVPQRLVGNVAAGRSTEVTWRFSPLLECSDYSLPMSVSVTATNASSVSTTRTVEVGGTNDTLACELQEERVIVLGDSYSSGEGAPPYDPGTAEDANNCHRGQTHVRTGRTSGIPVYACSGAIAVELVAPHQSYIDSLADDGSVLRPQATQVNQEEPRSPDLIVLTIGGNDAGFAPLAEHCVKADRCETDVLASGIGGVSSDERTLSGGEFVDQRLAGLREGLPHFLRLFDQAVNGDRRRPIGVVVLAYPDPLPPEDEFPANSNACPIGINFLGQTVTRDEVGFLKGFIADLNRAVDDSVEQMRREGREFYFLSSVEAALANNTLCDDEPYIHGVEISGLSARPESLHPTEPGYQEIWNTSLVEAASVETFERSAVDDLAGPVCDTSSGSATVVDLGVANRPELLSGDCTVLVAHGYSPRSIIQFMWFSNPIVVGRAVADDNGEARALVWVPDFLEPGEHRLEAFGLNPDGNYVTMGIPVTITEPFDVVPWLGYGMSAVLFVLGGVLVMRNSGRSRH